MVARPDAVRGQRVREPVGALVELGVREPTLTVDDGVVVGHGVGHPFPQVGQIEVHARSARAPSCGRP